MIADRRPGRSACDRRRRGARRRRRPARQRRRDRAATLLDALEANGVLVFRGLHLAPEQQVAFCRHLGEVDCSDGNHPVDGIYRVTLDPTDERRPPRTCAAPSHWHIDGCTPDGDECPQMATVLERQGRRRARAARPSSPAPTPPTTTSPTTRRAPARPLRVVHSLEASQRQAHTRSDRRDSWRRGDRRPTSEHPLVWTHRRRPPIARARRLGRPRRRAWISTRAGRCSTTCSPAPPRPIASTGTSGRSATP